MKTRMVAAALAALFWVGNGAQAQVEEEAPVLKGRVVDAVTGSPLTGVYVHLQGEEWGVFTDDEGRFELPKVVPGVLPISAEQLGYHDLTRDVRFPEQNQIILGLSPDPLLLEGFKVMTDRIERRIESQATYAHVLRRETLVSSRGRNLLDLIAARTFIHPVPCRTRAMAVTCAMIRGQVTPVRVYIDEMPTVGGLDFIAMLQPHEVQRVEVLHAIGQIRVYTEGFLRWVSQNNLALAPIGR